MNDLIAYDNDRINLIKKTVAKDATDLELQLFVEQCKRTGLDPITRQIYFMKGNDGKVQIQTSIDGFRLVAERSGAYEGQTPAMWCGKDGVWKDVWLSEELPMAARVGVWKKNFREPLYAIALFDEYAQKKKDGSLTFMWNKMPALMIAKVAESLALRKAFPNDLSGLYTQEEMGQAENNNSQTQKPQLKFVDEKTAPKHDEANTSGGDEINKAFSAASERGESFSGFEDTVQRPIEPTAGNDPGDYVITFGKHRGKKIKDFKKQELVDYANWLENAAREQGKVLQPAGEEFIKNVDAYLA